MNILDYIKDKTCFITPTNEKKNILLNLSENKNLYDTNWSGRHHKQSSKDKIRQSMKKENSTGKRTWINKDGVVKYLLNEHLQEYLDNGWELGRTGYKPRKNGQGKIIK